MKVRSRPRDRRRIDEKATQKIRILTSGYRGPQARKNRVNLTVSLIKLAMKTERHEESIYLPPLREHTETGSH